MTAPKPSAQSSWIDLVVESTKNVEAPERYFWWSSAAAISAVVKKNVFISRGGHYNLYPNIYVALVSKHSGLRKGHPISLISKFINGVQCTRVIEGRSSIQAVIKEFSNQITLENGKIMSDAHGIMVSGEFDTMLLKDPDALTILTALYNTHEHNGKWKNTLKGSAVEELKNPCISMLVASNEVLFDDFVKQKDVEGGFIARTFIIHESKRRTINDLIDPDPAIIDPKQIIQGLTEISKVKGEFQWSQEAKDIYRPWYREICTADYEDNTGSINRLGDSALKIAMILNLATRRDLILHGDDIELAISKCQECMTGVKTITRSTGISDLAPAQKRIIDRLLSAPNCLMQRRKLLQKLHPDLDAQVLDRVLETLDQAEVIVASRDNSNQICYKLTDKAIQMYTKFIGGD